LSLGTIEETVARNYGLLVSIANKYVDNRHYQLDDLIQVAAIGLIRAHKTWDQKKSKFSTHAYHCINNNLKRFVKNNKRHNYQELTDYPCSEPESINEYLPDLNPEDSFIIKMRVEGYNRSEIADILDISTNQLRHKLAVIYHNIRKANEA